MINNLTFWSQTLRKRWEVLLLWVGIGLIVSLGIILVQPFRYSATVRLLIIQRSSLTLDPFNALKAAERISDSLSQVVYTSTFFDQVMQTNYPIDRGQFSKDDRIRRKEWQKTIGAEVVRGTGLLSVSAYEKDHEQARLYALAVADVLMRQGPEYVGGGDIQVRLVDSPLLSRFPAKPNVLTNILSGLVLGLVAGMLYLAWTTPKEHRLFS